RSCLRRSRARRGRAPPRGATGKPSPDGTRSPTPAERARRSLVVRWCRPGGDRTPRGRMAMATSGPGRRAGASEEAGRGARDPRAPEVRVEEIERSGASVEEAIERALGELGVSEQE